MLGLLRKAYLILVCSESVHVWEVEKVSLDEDWEEDTEKEEEDGDEEW